MNIADIPSLTYVGQGLCLSWDAIDDTLTRWKKSYGIDLDPEFQRGHVWDMDTKIKFIEFMLKGGQVQPLRFNSPVFGGENHAKHSDLPETVVLVDGKQRLTTILDFMANKIPVFGGTHLSDFDKPNLLLMRTDITYNVNKLQTKKELYQWYLEMNEGQVAHSKDELQKVRKLLELNS